MTAVENDFKFNDGVRRRFGPFGIIHAKERNEKRPSVRKDAYEARQMKSDAVSATYSRTSLSTIMSRTWS